MAHPDTNWLNVLTIYENRVNDMICILGFLSGFSSLAFYQSDLHTNEPVSLHKHTLLNIRNARVE